MTQAKKKDIFGVSVMFLTWLIITKGLINYVSKPATGGSSTNILVAFSFLCFLIAAPFFLAIDFFRTRNGPFARILSMVLMVVIGILVIVAFLVAAKSQSGYCSYNFSECFDW